MMAQVRPRLNSTKPQSERPTNSITEFIKVNDCVVELVLHTLQEDRHRQDLVEWPARCHIEEITNHLKPVLEARIRRAGRRWTVEETKKKTTTPKITTGETVRMAYSFKSTHVHLHCMFQTKDHFKGFRMFGEKLVVYACPLRRDSQANKSSLTTASGAQTSLDEGLGSQTEKTSSYFREAEPQVPKPKLPRPLSRRRPLMINTKTPTCGENNGSVDNQNTKTSINTEGPDPQQPGISDANSKSNAKSKNGESEMKTDIKSEQVSESSSLGEVELLRVEEDQGFRDLVDHDWEDPAQDVMLTEFMETTMHLPPVTFTPTECPIPKDSPGTSFADLKISPVLKQEKRYSLLEQTPVFKQEKRYSMLEQTLERLQRSPRIKSLKTNQFYKSSTSSSEGSKQKSSCVGKRDKNDKKDTGFGVYDFSDSDPESCDPKKPVVRRARGRWRKLMQLMETDDENEDVFDPSPPSPSSPRPPTPPSSHWGTPAGTETPSEFSQPSFWKKPLVPDQEKSSTPLGSVSEFNESPGLNSTDPQNSEYKKTYSLHEHTQGALQNSKLERVSKPSSSGMGHDYKTPTRGPVEALRTASGVPLPERKSPVELYAKGASLQRLSGRKNVAGACKIDMSHFVDDAIDDSAISIEDEIRSIRSVGDLTLAHMAYLVTKHERDLRDIFQGKKPTRRHLDYKAGGKQRNNLKYQIPMGCFSDEQHDTIMELLLAMFCRKHNNYLDYVLKVMLPEVLILVYMDVNHTDADQAEAAMSLAAPNVNFVL